MNKMDKLLEPEVRGFVGVVVITSALHAEGLGFEPRTNLFLSFF